MLSVREIEQHDIDLIISYWLQGDAQFFNSMGVDVAKIPSNEEWKKILSESLQYSYEEKKSYWIIWLLDGNAIGHSNVNKIIFGKEAFMHLHLWNTGTRQKGMGSKFVKMTLPYFFSNLKLREIYCEPFALNPAPNKTLEKVGFEFEKEYITTPGYLNFEQPVNRWRLSYKKFKEMSK